MMCKVKVPRIMVAAAGSGSGKTTVTCGLLQAFVLRGIRTTSFKCGPDYIDPMFHTEVLGVPSRNLDLFFTDEETTRFLFCRAAEQAFEKGEKSAAQVDAAQSSSSSSSSGSGSNSSSRSVSGSEAAAQSHLAVIEGVMGYYDGLAAISTEASSYDLARVTETPAVLLVDCKGKSVSILAEIKGFLEYREDSGIAGVILNRLSPMLYPDLKKMIEEELNVKVYGYLPVMKDCGLESRHLGLITAKEVGNLREIVTKLARQMEETVDLDGLYALGEGVPELTRSEAAAQVFPAMSDPAEKKNEASRTTERLRIGVAQDKAFCFYYRDNLDLLEELGAELVPFSPLSDGALPENLQGLIFGGGYPELYLERLSENWPIMEEIRFALEDGMPCLAECGGFMYLHEWIVDEKENRWPMVGAVEGESYPTGKLGRFGYIELTALRDTLLCKEGETLRGHEFHYWDSTNTGDCFRARKPLRSRSWDCILADGKKAKGNLFAGYPHIHFYSNPKAAPRFIDSCRGWRNGGKIK